MRFNIIGHACLTVESRAKKLVIDPWLVDPVYWGSWWHRPEPIYEQDVFSSDYLYITHWHFDHFHIQSLSLFKNKCQILVPKFPVSNMVSQLREIGFKHIRELGHGEVFHIAPGFEIVSYQIQYQDDSILVIHADGTTMVNLNDAKPLPSTWRRLRKRFPKVDFMLRSHSPAWSYPSCFTFEDPSDAIPINKETYMEAFRTAAKIIHPRYAIPFASSICHLHREVVPQNDYLVSADELINYMQAHKIEGTTLVLMPHGSSWSNDHGFEICNKAQEDDIEKMIGSKREQLQKIYEWEVKQGLSFDAFESFFQKFLKSIFLFRPFLKIKWVFVIKQALTEFWSVDVGRGKLERLSAEPPDYTSKIVVHPAVLANALENLMFTNIDIAKRWQVHIRKGGLTKHFVMMVLVLLYEAGYLDLRNFIRLRFFISMMKRLPEAVDYIVLLLRMSRKGSANAVESVSSLS